MTYPEADYSAGLPKRKAQCRKLAEVFEMNGVFRSKTAFFCPVGAFSRLQPVPAAGR